MQTQAKATSFAGEREKLTVGHNLRMEAKNCKFLCDAYFHHRTSWALFSVVKPRGCLGTTLAGTFLGTTAPQTDTDRYAFLPTALSSQPCCKAQHRRADSTLSYDLQQNLFTPLCQHKILMTWLSFPRSWRLLYSASGRQMPRVNEHLSIKGGKYLDLSGQGGNSVMNWRRKLT